MTREQPEQAPPPVQRLRVRYAKRGRLRFTSHRDFSRAFERAVFRARVPMAYSSGFNPHPRISYAGAAPTGAASEAEYLELALAEVVDPGRVHAALDEALPDGLDVVEVVEAPGAALADLLQVSRWRIALPVAGRGGGGRGGGVPRGGRGLVERMTKKGMRDFDCRAAVLSLVATDRGGGRRARPGAAPPGAGRPPRRRALRADLAHGLDRSAYPCSPGWPRDRWTRHRRDRRPAAAVN